MQILALEVCFNICLLFYLDTERKLLGRDLPIFLRKELEVDGLTKKGEQTGPKVLVGHLGMHESEPYVTGFSALWLWWFVSLCANDVASTLLCFCACVRAVFVLCVCVCLRVCLCCVCVFACTNYRFIADNFKQQVLLALEGTVVEGLWACTQYATCCVCLRCI